MRIIINKYVPFGPFDALSILSWIFVKDINKLSPTKIYHERIHWEQQKELLILGFYLLYVVFFIIEFFRCMADKQRGHIALYSNSVWLRAYRSIPFEREAYTYMNSTDYLGHRKHFAWING